MGFLNLFFMNIFRSERNYIKIGFDEALNRLFRLMIEHFYIKLSFMTRKSREKEETREIFQPNFGDASSNYWRIKLIKLGNKNKKQTQ